MYPILTSASNPKVKYLISLEKSRERRNNRQFAIEGLKELKMASDAGYVIDSVFFCPDLVDDRQLLSNGISQKILQPVNKAVFAKLAYRDSTGGVIAIANEKDHALSDLKLTSNPLLLVVESVEKPGNLGALLRTADAAGVDAVISCDPLTDYYNPNTIRSSLGCVFTNQKAKSTTNETISWLKANGIRIFCTYLEASVPYTQMDFTKPCAIVMGSEANGLTENWIRNADKNIIIPMKGKIDSMNVSVSAAIVVFEAVRQRST